MCLRTLVYYSAVVGFNVPMYNYIFLPCQIPIDQIMSTLEKPPSLSKSSGYYDSIPVSSTREKCTDMFGSDNYEF